MTSDEFIDQNVEDAKLALEIYKEIDKFHLVTSKVSLVTYLFQQIIEEKKNSGDESMEDFVYRMTVDMESIWLTGDTR